MFRGPTNWSQKQFSICFYYFRFIASSHVHVLFSYVVLGKLVNYPVYFAGYFLILLEFNSKSESTCILCILDPLTLRFVRTSLSVVLTFLLTFFLFLFYCGHHCWDARIITCFRALMYVLPCVPVISPSDVLCVIWFISQPATMPRGNGSQMIIDLFIQEHVADFGCQKCGHAE